MVESVDVVIFSHNHSSFVEDALHGVFSQLTSSHVRMRIHDDASNDGTPDLLRQLLRDSPFESELIVAKENRYQGGSLFKYEFAVESNADYVAFLDADDYWTDPLKLELQIEALRKYDHASICHTAFEGVDESGHLLSFRPEEKFLRPSIPGHYLSQQNFMGTLTVMVRRENMPKTLPAGFNRLRGVDDYPIWALVADRSTIAYVDEVTARYRLHSRNNFAAQPLETRNRQILHSMVYVANSVHPQSVPFWLDGIENFVKRNSRGRGILNGLVLRVERFLMNLLSTTARIFSQRSKF